MDHAIVEDVISLARESVKDAHREKLTSFVEAYARHLPAQLGELSPRDMLSFLMERLAFLEEEPSDDAKVAVGRPSNVLDTSDVEVIAIETRLPDCVFIVKTLKEFVRGEGLQIELPIHALVGVVQRGGGVNAVSPNAAEGKPVSHVYLHVTAVPEDRWEHIREALEYRLNALLVVTRHYQSSLDKLAAARAALEAQPSASNGKAEAVGGSLELIDWLRDHHFVFLGYGYYGADAPKDVKNSLGLLSLAREEELHETIASIAASRIPRSELFSFYRTDVLSPVKSRAQLRYVGFKDLDPDGKCLGEHVFVGLLSSTSVHEPNQRVPIVAQRMSEALKSFELRSPSYAYKKMRAILDSLPLEDLFYMTQEELREVALFIKAAEESSGTSVSIRRRVDARRVSICCVVERERFSEALRDRVHDVICEALNVPRLRSYVRFVEDEGPVRLHFYGSPSRSTQTAESLKALEGTITAALQSWEERLRTLIFDRFPNPNRPTGTATGKYLALSATSAPDLWRRYRSAFPTSYQESRTPLDAVEDISSLEKVVAEGTTQVQMLHLPATATRPAHTLLRLISLSDLELNSVVPVLEHMGLRTRARASNRLALPDNGGAFLMAFEVDGLDGEPISDPDTLHRLAHIIDRVLGGRLHSDRLLGLALSSGLDAEQLNLIIGYRNCFLQMFAGYTRISVTDALLRHPECAAIWVHYFTTRFSPDISASPDERRENLLPPLAQEYADKLEAVSIIQDDIILRLLFSLVENTLRTNFYIHGRGAIVSFKIDSKRIDHIPRPRPLYEIYVHGPQVEGVHLRGGMVARGGIRHSDRPDDYRTEVHGLVKTQMTKNTIIVPVGSKGGFITRRVHEDRDSMEQERKTQYENFMGGLLDITDNLAGSAVVPPDGVLRYDGDDPYLVVAADKGTASLSDTANAVSQRYGFWLDDAFASGGSEGYDHKEMGITARGAWVCVERHFREMGVDIRETPITVVGVGDMSGDVFGNGMLLNDKMKLIAAFDHRNIFIDPNPDAAATFAERKRMFELPRSSWMDYDQTLLSEGGAIYDRNAKVIELSKQACQALGAKSASMNGPELMQHILRADVDLLWLGGIGTYVKNSRELHIEVGDKANDLVRVDAPQVRAKVIGEGANLGFTSLARTEYSLAGGRCNTDAMDNSAGVDCSDHEVNMKILMVHLQEQGVVADREARNIILRANEDEVGLQCERDNHRQSALLSLETRKSLSNVEQYVAVLHYLEKHGLHRPSEFLPTDDELREWCASGHTVPRNVLAVMVAYTKNDIYPRILASDLPDMPYFERCLADYFPSKVVEQFGEYLDGHRLRREIIATVVTNEIINAAGCTFVIALANESRADVPELALRHWICDELLGGRKVRDAIHALDRKVPAEMQYEALAALEATLYQLVRWWCWNEGTWSIAPADLPKLQPEFDAVVEGLYEGLPEAERIALAGNAARLEGAGFAAELASKISCLPLMRHAFLALSAQRASGETTANISRLFHETGEQLHLRQLETLLDAQSLSNNWDARFQSILRRQIAELRRQFIPAILAKGKSNLVARFVKKHQERVDQIGESIQVISKSAGSVHVPIFIVLDDYRVLLD